MSSKLENQKLYYDEIGYILYCFILYEKNEYIRIFDEEKNIPFWDNSWTRYFDAVNQNPHQTHYVKPYSVIMTVSMWSDQFYYETIDGAEHTFEFLGDILNPNIFSWVSKVENLDIAVFAGLMQNGIPMEALPNGEWRKITPGFLKKHGEQAKKLLLQTKQNKDKKKTWGSYKEYLKTEHWQSQRKAALHRANYRCQVCNSSNKQLDVHHRTYERLGVELPADLIVLCNDCHGLFHKNGRLQAQ